MNIKLKNDEPKQLSSSIEIFKIMQRILMRENKIDRKREHFWTISLDNALTVLNIELVSMGSATTTIAEPAEVFSIPLQKKAVHLVLVHNHPSGTLKPSDADKDITDRLIQVGNIMHTPVLDHLIITEESYYSFRDSGLMDELRKSLKYYIPTFDMRVKSEQIGEERGLKKGEQLGEKNKALEMARVMKRNNEPIEKIMTYTGLTKEAIDRLKAEG